MSTKKQNTIPTEDIINHELRDMKVTILSKLEKINGVVLHGDAVLNAEKSTFEFFQKISSRKKNKVLARREHTSFRATLEGDKVRVTCVFNPKMSYALDTMLTEFRECFKKMQQSDYYKEMPNHAK